MRKRSKTRIWKNRYRNMIEDEKNKLKEYERKYQVAK